MSDFKNPTPVCHLIQFTAADVAIALRYGTDATQQSASRRICRTFTQGCTLDAPAAQHLIKSTDEALLRHRGALLSNTHRSIVRSLDRLFWLFHDALDVRVDMDTDCSCSWELRLDDAEALTHFLMATARAYWSTSAKVDWMVRLIESLACNVTDIAERHDIPARFASDDPSVEARADRLAVCLFDMANDLACGNWGRASSAPG